MRIRKTDIKFGEQHFFRRTENPNVYVVKSLQPYMKIGTNKDNRAYLDLGDVQLTIGDEIGALKGCIKAIDRVIRGRVILTIEKCK